MRLKIKVLSNWVITLVNAKEPVISCYYYGMVSRTKSKTAAIFAAG